MSTYTLKLAVDKSRNRVVFAESDDDFVEVLLCFLKVPLGSISRLCGNNSSIGSIDKLYKSVENLDNKYFNTNACKNMLLCPTIADKHLSDSLRIYDTSTHLYCWNCSQKRDVNIVFVVPYEGVLCYCRRKMDSRFYERLVNGQFLKGRMRFLITDDMVITLPSTRRIMDLTCKPGDKIELQEINVGKEEIIQLLRHAALNKMPFTSVFVGETNDGLQPSRVKEEAKSPRMSPKSEEKKMIKLQKDVAQLAIVKKEDENAKGASKPEEVEKTITVNLWVDKRNHKVLYAECESDFVDLLVSFLTFPFGLVVDILRGNEKLADIGSFGNLFDDVDRLSSTDLFKDPSYKDMLMKPNLPPYFSVGTMLNTPIDPLCKKILEYACLNNDCAHYEKVSADSSCSRCAKLCSPLIHVDLKEHDRDPPIESGFMEKAIYMVTDDLVITPFCSISSFSLLNKAGVLQQCVEEKTFRIGPKEAKKLLQTCLTSKTPLTDAFLL